jgi:hypothetical protein
LRWVVATHRARDDPPRVAAASCKDGHKYRVYLNADGRLLVDEQKWRSHVTARTRILSGAVLALAVCGMSAPAPGWPSAGGSGGPARRFLDTHLLVTWYGNPNSCRMGILGELTGNDRATGLRAQAAAYAPLTSKTVVAAYHLVAVVAQPARTADDPCRRRESIDAIRSLLGEARTHGFSLVLDVQPGRAAVRGEIEYLLPVLKEPDVHLALDPEFAMQPGEVPGRRIGSMRAGDITAAVDLLDRIVTEHRLPPKVLVVHQFTLGMLPDKARIRRSPQVDLVLTMDGFGSPPSKRASYRAVTRQQPLDFPGFKLFYRLDGPLLSPTEVLALDPPPAVIVYQ